MNDVDPPPSRLSFGDLLRVGSHGLRTRRLRTALSSLGVAIGIAAMVGVIGLSSSSQARLLSELDALGTNLLRVAPGQTLTGDDASLPESAPNMINGIDAVENASAITNVDGVTVRATDLIPETDTSGISVAATDPGLIDSAALSLRAGRWHDSASHALPTVVLGSKAAERLGIDRTGTKVWLGDQWFTVIGILEPTKLASELDATALIGRPVAQQLFDASRSASTIYVRANPESVTAVRGVLAATANPEKPEEVDVSRPSDALAAKAAATGTFTSLFLGLGAVALLVGGVGIANVMVISVLERRREIGLRRAIGATKRHIAAQFLTEALLLSGLGGVSGAAIGVVVTSVYAAGQGWQIVVPPGAVGAGVGCAIVIGAAAGLYPAARASRLSPTEALRST